MKTCLRCGGGNRHTAKYCSHCGGPLAIFEKENPDGGPSVTEQQALKAELARRQRNLSILEEQRARFGIDVPLHLVHQIDEERERIDLIKKRLSNLTDEPSLATQYFSKATKAMIAGDLWEAKRYYQMTITEDPYYPRATEQLSLVQRQIALKERPIPSPIAAPTGRLAREKRRTRPVFIYLAISLVSIMVILGIIYLLWIAGWLF